MEGERERQADRHTGREGRRKVRSKRQREEEN